MVTEPAPTPLAAALDSVGDRWTLLLIEALLDGPRRFGDLQEALQGIAPNVLTQRLRRLEGEGLVLAQPYSERPQRFVYELTAVGSRAGRRAAPAGRLGRAAPRGRRAAPPRRLRHARGGALVVPDLRAAGGRRRDGAPTLRLSGTPASCYLEPSGRPAHTPPRPRRQAAGRTAAQTRRARAGLRLHAPPHGGRGSGRPRAAAGGRGDRHRRRRRRARTRRPRTSVCPPPPEPRRRRTDTDETDTETTETDSTTTTPVTPPADGTGRRHGRAPAEPGHRRRHRPGPAGGGGAAAGRRGRRAQSAPPSP